MEGDIIRRADPQFGLLHRGTEKLCEGRSPAHVIPYVDRMDYVANLFQEHALVGALESLAGGRLAPRAAVIRCVWDELSRCLNHLLTTSAVSLDLGAMGPIFWAFEERELIMELMERTSGARMHTAMYDVYGAGNPVLFGRTPPLDISEVIRRGARMAGSAFLGLVANRALRARLSGLGQFSPAKLHSHGVGGVIARSAGLWTDSRLGLASPSYGAYPSLTLRTFLGRRGDNYDRFILRLKELFESLRVVGQSTVDAGNASPTRHGKFGSMESTITKFQTAEAVALRRGSSYFGVEGPKGEFGARIWVDGSGGLWRVQFRSPVSRNMHLISSAGRGCTFADFVATFCSLDIVLGEIDR
jgi:NADH:ubiquinone oxidoreductase subunit D